MGTVNGLNKDLLLERSKDRADEQVISNSKLNKRGHLIQTYNSLANLAEYGLIENRQVQSFYNDIFTTASDAKQLSKIPLQKWQFL